MHVDVVDDLGALSQLRSSWDSVYATDPEAQFFLSWTWVSRTIDRRRGWFVLAARPSVEEPPVAFFPLRLVPGDQIVVAGRGASDYNGFLCTPGYDEPALGAFAWHLRGERWARLRLDYLSASVRRMRSFLRHFPRRSFRLRDIETVNDDGINHCICPLARLPADWETYLRDHVSRTRRDRIETLLREVERSPDLRITVAGADTAHRDIEILLRLWAERWAERKADRLTGILSAIRHYLRGAAEAGCLFLPVLWSGATPVGALATLVDPQKRAFLFKIGARDPQFHQPSPMLALHAFSLRTAIQRGYRTYEFLRGNDPYKYAFSDSERRLRKLVVSTRP